MRIMCHFYERETFMNTSRYDQYGNYRTNKQMFINSGCVIVSTDLVLKAVNSILIPIK